MVEAADPHVVKADGCTCILSLRLVKIEERSVISDEGIRRHEGILKALDLVEERGVVVLAFTLRLEGGDDTVSRVLRSSRRSSEVGGDEALLVDVCTLSR